MHAFNRYLRLALILAPLSFMSAHATFNEDDSGENVATHLTTKDQQIVQDATYIKQATVPS